LPIENPKSPIENPIGRLAPSPTGYLHLGNARSFLLAWLQMRSLGGRIILRIEDLDQARTVKDAEEGIVRDLQWLGLDWDNPLTPDYFQSNRFERYHAAIEKLRARGLLYECYCSRKELHDIASAPHGPAGARYPGTCRDLTDAERAERGAQKAPALRFRVEAETWMDTDWPGGRLAVPGMMPGRVIRFHDLIAGDVVEDVGEAAGDFIIARADGVPSYQLAVVLDDIAMGITHVLRGEDLLDSTPRQILLFNTFNAVPPTYAHVPLILAPDGQRLAKRHGSISLAELRDAGHSAEEVVGWLAWSCGLRSAPEPCRAEELVEGFSVEMVRREVTVLKTLQPLDKHI
jgi:glutamyl-tRNA synthetase